MKLPKSYIKKYGGINKKAWNAFKSSKKKSTRGSRTKTRGVSHMARKRFKRVKSRSRSKKGSKLAGFAAAFIYGAARNRISNLIQPVAVKLAPVAGQFADEAAMYLAAELIGKRLIGRYVPIARQASIIGQKIEVALAGAEAAGMLFQGGAAAPNGGSNGLTVI